MLLELIRVGMYAVPAYLHIISTKRKQTGRAEKLKEHENTQGGHKRGKQHNWTEEDILEALNDIKNGQSINALRSKTSITVCH
jgi:hypothetical protein